MDTLIIFAWLAGICWSIWIATLPFQILTELRRQAAAREEADRLIIALLSQIARKAEGTEDPSVTASRQQVLDDLRKASGRAA